MSLRKLFLFSVATLALLTGASAQSIQVDGLQAEEVNASFGDREVTFTASYLNKSITYGKLLVPDELRGDLVDLRSNGRVRTVVDGVGIFQPPGQQDRRLSLAYKFRDDASVPELQGWQYGEFSGNRNSGLKPKNGEGTVLLDAEGRDRVFTSNFSDQEVRWNITVNSHYEHLIVNYDLIYNESGQPAEIVWETQDVYSGEEPDLIPFESDFVSRKYFQEYDEVRNFAELTPDYRYDDSVKNVTAIAVYPENSSIAEKYSEGQILDQNVDVNYSDYREQALENGMNPESLVNFSERSNELQISAFKVRLRENSTQRVGYALDTGEKGEEYYLYLNGSSGGGGGVPEEDWTASVSSRVQDLDIRNDGYVIGGGSGGEVYQISNSGSVSSSNYFGSICNGGTFGVDTDGSNDYAVGCTDADKIDGWSYTEPSNWYLFDIGVNSETGSVFIGSDNNELIKLDSSGDTLWENGDAISSDVNTVEADTEGSAYIGTDQGDILKKSSSSYSNWVYSGHTGEVMDVSINQDLGYLVSASSDDNTIRKLDWDGTEIWSISTSGAGSVDIGDNGYIYSAGGDDAVKMYYSNGTLKDSYSVDGSSTGYVAVSDKVDGKSYLTVSDEEFNDVYRFTITYNSAPSIDDAIFRDNRKSDSKKVELSLDDKSESDISGYSGFSSVSEFTNSSLIADVSLPFSSTVNVSDSAGAFSSNRVIDLSESDSGLREHTFSHTLSTQRANQTVEIFNDAASSINYNVTLQNYGAVIQGESWDGTIPASSSIRHTGVWENDWITGETESSFDKYEDTGFYHGEDEQVLVNQTRLVVDNSRSFQFSGVDLSSVCGRTTTGDVPSGQGVSVTTDCNRLTFTVDFIDESNSSLLEDGAFGHGLDTQGVSRRKNLTETGGYSWTGVNVSSPEMPGSCVNCGQREVDVAADSTSSVYYNSTGDWIESSVEVFEKGQYGVADLDQQSFYNQTSLEASNSQSFRFNSVDLSSKCSVTTSGDVPPGSSTVTTACTNSTFSGDWIQNEVNESSRFQEGSVVIGDGVSELYRAGQNVSVENTRSDVNLTVDFSGQLVEEQSCSVVDSVRTVRASTAAEFQFEKLCSPGEVVSHEPVQKTETATDFKYTYRGEFEVYSNLTEEEPITFAVEKSRLSNFEERLPTETEVYVNGRGSGLSVDQRYFNDTEYVTVEVPDDFGNSSLHEGSHSVKLVYYESKSPGGTSGGASTGSIVGGSSGVQETVENVTGEYNWTVSAAVASDTQKFTVARAPGDTFEKQILLENTGSSDVPLNISCTSQDNFCHYVDLGVDHVVLNTGSFSQKQVTVSGNIPANASAGSSYTFRILVEDPSSNGLGSDGAATVDFLVTVSDFWGGIISYAGKLTEMRELQPPFGVGSPIPYPFALLPVLSAVVVGGFSWGLRRLLEIEASTKVQILDFALVVFTFLVSVPLWP